MCMVIQSNDGKVLMNRRHQDLVFPNAWVFPGGHIEVGESLEEGAKREVFEETGLDVGSNFEDKIEPLFIFESASGMANGISPIQKGHLIVYFKIKIDQNSSEIVLKL